MSRDYVLTAAAEADLRSLIRYTRSRWGDAQTRKYVGALERGMRRLATGDGHFRMLGDIHDDLRAARCEHHFIFCLTRKNAPALIVAILHEQMDLMIRLNERLR
ncbi:MAG: type II toxin-antitoxin system RelE/ParE family toxin [Novosphingobium sp.]